VRAKCSHFQQQGSSAGALENGARNQAEVANLDNGKLPDLGDLPHMLVN
jgi:hypothetical protein